MIGFSINCGALSSLLKLCSLKGKTISGKDKEVIDSFIVELEKDKTKIAIVDDIESIAMVIVTKPQKITGIGKIPISISDFRTVLARFKSNDTINVLFDAEKQTTTILRASPKLGFTFNSISGSSINSTLVKQFPIVFDGEIPKVFKKKDEEILVDQKYAVRFDIEHSALSELIKDGEVTGLNFYPLSFNTIDNKLMFNSVNNKKGNVGEREIEYVSYKVYLPTKEINLKFGSSLTNVINGLDGKVRMYLSEGLPLYIVMENSDFSAQIILTEAELDQDINEELGV